RFNFSWVEGLTAPRHQDMFFRSKKLLGLDIGSANIKLAELDVSRGGATLNSIPVAPTPARAITGGEITDPAAIADTVKAMILNSGTKRKHVAVAMWGTSIIAKRISIPNMDEKLV